MCSLAVEDHSAIWQGKAELPANIWDMKPDDFSLPKELSCEYKVILQPMKSLEQK